MFYARGDARIDHRFRLVHLGSDGFVDVRAGRMELSDFPGCQPGLTKGRKWATHSRHEGMRRLYLVDAPRKTP